MPTVIAHHDVKDVDHWLTSGKRQALFGPLGITTIRTFVDPNNPTHVGVMMDVPDLEAWKEVLASQACADAMAHDGVLPETVVVLIES